MGHRFVAFIYLFMYRGEAKGGIVNFLLETNPIFIT